MKLSQIHTIASSLGIHAGKLPKAELIKSIQKSEGNFDCFSSATDGNCNQESCLWREDCFVAAQRTVPS